MQINRHHKRSGQFSTSNNRHLSADSSHWIDQPDFLPPPAKVSIFILH